MPTPEERIVILERAITEYRPVLRDITYELTMVKGLITNEIGITEGLRHDVGNLQDQVARLENSVTTLGNNVAILEGNVKGQLTSLTGKIDKQTELLNNLLAKMQKNPNE
jgi:hypothetical protein